MNPDLEKMRSRIVDSFQKQTIMSTIGASIKSIELGEVVIQLPNGEGISQQDGFVHAGVITTIVDSACGYAAMTLMPEEARVLTIEFKSNFVSPAIGDVFLAKGTVKKSGKTLMVTSGEVYAYKESSEDDFEGNSEDKTEDKLEDKSKQDNATLVSLMQATMMVLHPTNK